MGILKPQIKPACAAAFAQWKNAVAHNYVNFKGRATRAQYWQFVAVETVIGLLLAVTIIGPALFILATFLPSLAIISRRLHDLGKSGWLQLIPYAVMLLGWLLNWAGMQSWEPWLVNLGSLFSALGSLTFIGLSWFLTTPSEGENRYGPASGAGTLPPELAGGFKLGFKNYVNFSTASPRAEFWWFCAGLYFVFSALGALSGLPAVGPVFSLLSLLLFLGTVVPFIAACVRRLRDIGASPLYVLEPVAVVLVQFILLYILIMTLASRAYAGTFIVAVITLIFSLAGWGYFAAIMAMPSKSAAVAAPQAATPELR
ncbi:MAG: DUF805 domain-containing protein [Succinivibrio sp.]|jgi:uncharacterized membrane protein YhaH (DUF805 family)|nr:DUF805 domain-containing protein [Succinivibrio sp.]